jgi:hypothetical protein
MADLLRDQPYIIWLGTSSVTLPSYAYQSGWSYAVQNEQIRDVPEWVVSSEWAAGFADAQHYLDNRYIEI